VTLVTFWVFCDCRW